MTRSEARIKVSIWDDQDFLDLERDDRLVYLFLVSQPDVAATGVLPIRLRRWCSKLAMTAQEVTTALECLQDARFVVVDWAMEEVLVRSFIRRDEIYRQPNMLRAALRSLPSISSGTIREALLIELERIGSECSATTPVGSVPVLAQMVEALWGSLAKVEPSTERPMSESAVNGNTEPIADGFGDGIADGFPEGIGEPLVEGKGVGVGVVVDVKDRRTNSSSPPKIGSDDDPDFVIFWNHWPRKIGKGQARSAWRSALKKTDAATIIERVKVFAANCRGKDMKFIPHASTWLNGERWDDEIEPASLHAGAAVESGLPGWAR